MENKWVIALKIYHLIQNQIPEPSIADEFFEVGTSVENIHPKKHNWLIPVRGTAEYNQVSVIYELIKSHSTLERMSRDLLHISKENNTLANFLINELDNKFLDNK